MTARHGQQSDANDHPFSWIWPSSPEEYAVVAVRMQSDDRMRASFVPPLSSSYSKPHFRDDAVDTTDVVDDDLSDPTEELESTGQQTEMDRLDLVDGVTSHGQQLAGFVRMLIHGKEQM